MSELFEHNLNTHRAATDIERYGSRWYRRVYASVLAGFLLPLVLVGMFNFANDRYALFRDDRVFIPEADLDYFRLKHLLQNPDKRSVILLGTSRASALDLQGRVNESSYTFPIAGGGIYYYLLALRTLIVNDIVPDTVIIGLGEAVIKPVSATQHQRPYLYPRPEDLSLTDYLRDYLLFVPGERDFRIMRNRIGGYMRGIDSERGAQIIATGRSYCAECESQVSARSPNEHAMVLSEGIRRWPARPPVSERRKEQGMQYALKTIRDMQAIAEKYNFRLFIYIDPMYRQFYLKKDIPTLMRFRRELAQSDSFLDFGSFNDAFNNPGDFLDPLHYNERLGNAVADDIAAALRGETDRLALGTWVTPANVAAHTRQLEDTYPATNGRRPDRIAWFENCIAQAKLKIILASTQ